MMQYEFERIAGYEVSTEDYNNIIEPMYNATDLDKWDFVKVIDRKRFDLGAKKKNLIKKMREIAKHLKDTCTHYYDGEARDELTKAVEEYQKLIGAYGYIINVADFWSCYYPKKVEFYTGKYYTFKTIDLIEEQGA